MDGGEIPGLCSRRVWEGSSAECIVNCTRLERLCDHIATIPLLLGNSNYHGNQTHSITQTEAYGYGFVMIFTISITSLLGVAIVPFLRQNSRLATIYRYLITLLISMGVAALVSDALLHLIPNALDIHLHQHSGEAESGVNKGTDEREVVWKMCAVLGGVMSFFILELFLHACSSRLGHSHSHGVPTSAHDISTSSDSVALIHSFAPLENCPSHNGTLSNSDTYRIGSETYRHNTADSTDVNATKKQPSLAESGQGYGALENREEGDSAETTHKASSWARPVTSIKPLAWVIIIGDGLHNLTDGLAVGVAISQSLGSGLSTAIAIMFHEIPHELSDYAILLHTGMSWYKALLLNFLSALTALVGFFIGVAVGTDSEATNDWLLAVIAGQFLYIALVDLLPEVLHSREMGWQRVGHIAMTFTGFSIGFLVLLFIALYEDEINLSVS